MPQKKSHQSARNMTGPGKAIRPREQLRVLKSIPRRDLHRIYNVTQAQKIGAPGERPSGPAQRNYQIEYSQTEPRRADSSCLILQLAVAERARVLLVLKRTQSTQYSQRNQSSLHHLPCSSLRRLWGQSPTVEPKEGQ